MKAGSLTQSLTLSYSLHATNTQSKMDALSTVKLVPQVEHTLTPLLFTQSELGAGEGVKARSHCPHHHQERH